VLIPSLSHLYPFGFVFIPSLSFHYPIFIPLALYLSCLYPFFIPSLSLCLHYITVPLPLHTSTCITYRYIHYIPLHTIA